MSGVFNLPTKEQFDMQNVLLASIASHIGTEGIKITNWEDVQRVVRMGLHEKIFTVGDQFIANYSDTPYVLDVIGINKDIPSDKTYKNSMTLQFRDCIMNCQFDAPESLYYAEVELPAGEHVFTQDDGSKYKFTTTQTIPIGGQVYVNSWGDPYVPLKIITYAADRTTVIEGDIEVTSTTDDDTLGEVNVQARCRYGSNNYMESAVKQFLNSDAAAFNWVAKNKFDRPPTGAPYTGAGFLKNLDPELAAVIGPVDKQVARNTVTDGGGQDLFSDKAFLLSRVEVGFGTEGTTTGESVYPYYSGVTDAGRIKLLSGSPRGWWLRSPRVGSSYSAWTVTTSGILSTNSANFASGLSPACVII